MALAEGDKLGPYEIMAPIGAGGMGEVYRAYDTKLKRDVALKVLRKPSPTRQVGWPVSEGGGSPLGRLL
jgi:serine/threonine protein kinase